MPIDAFMDWARAVGVDAHDLPAYESGAAGILALTRGERVAPEHVDEALALARGSGFAKAELVSLREVGKALLRFQAESEGLAPRTIAIPACPPRATSGTDPAGVVAAAAPTAVPRSARPRVPWWLAVGIGLLGGGAAALIFMARNARPAVLPAAASSADPAPLRVPLLGLAARFPEGWRHSPGGDRTHADPTGSQVKSSFMFRGAAAEDPEASLFLAVLPARDSSDASDEALLKAAERGQRGAARSLSESHADFRPVGCEVTAVGARRAGLCIGKATRGEEALEVRNYLFAGPPHPIVAVFVSRPSVSDPAVEAARILETLAAR